MDVQKNTIPVEVTCLLKILTRYFYLDQHIILIDFLINVRYASEYSISKELNMKNERIRMITNFLHKENIINFEDRLFKKLKSDKNVLNEKKIYKLRYWFIDFNLLLLNLKLKLNKIFKKKTNNILKLDNIEFICSRKICEKIYYLKNLSDLPFDHSLGLFYCTNYLNQRVLCGSKIFEKKKKNILTNKKDILSVNNIYISYAFIIKRLVKCYRIFD